MPQSPHYIPGAPKQNRYRGLRKKRHRNANYVQRPSFVIDNTYLRGLLPQEIEQFYQRIEQIRNAKR